MLMMARLNSCTGVRGHPAIMLYRLDPFFPIIIFKSPSFPLNYMLFYDGLSPCYFINSNRS